MCSERAKWIFQRHLNPFVHGVLFEKSRLHCDTKFHCWDHSAKRRWKPQLDHLPWSRVLNPTQRRKTLWPFRTANTKQKLYSTTCCFVGVFLQEQLCKGYVILLLGRLHCPQQSHLTFSRRRSDAINIAMWKGQHRVLVQVCRQTHQNMCSQCMGQFKFKSNTSDIT